MSPRTTTPFKTKHRLLAIGAVAAVVLGTGVSAQACDFFGWGLGSNGWSTVSQNDDFHCGVAPDPQTTSDCDYGKKKEAWKKQKAELEKKLKEAKDSAAAAQKKFDESVAAKAKTETLLRIEIEAKVKAELEAKMKADASNATSQANFRELVAQYWAKVADEAQKDAKKSKEELEKLKASLAGTNVGTLQSSLTTLQKQNEALKLELEKAKKEVAGLDQAVDGLLDIMKQYQFDAATVDKATAEKIAKAEKDAADKIAAAQKAADDRIKAEKAAADLKVAAAEAKASQAELALKNQEALKKQNEAAKNVTNVVPAPPLCTGATNCVTSNGTVIINNITINSSVDKDLVYTHMRDLLSRMEASLRDQRPGQCIPMLTDTQLKAWTGSLPGGIKLTEEQARALMKQWMGDKMCGAPSLTIPCPFTANGSATPLAGSPCAAMVRSADTNRVTAVQAGSGSAAQQGVAGTQRLAAGTSQHAVAGQPAPQAAGQQAAGQQAAGQQAAGQQAASGHHASAQQAPAAPHQAAAQPQSASQPQSAAGAQAPAAGSGVARQGAGEKMAVADASMGDRRADGALPRTGSNAAPIVWMGLGLLLLGGAAVFIGYRRRSAAERY